METNFKIQCSTKQVENISQKEQIQNIHYTIGFDGFIVFLLFLCTVRYLFGDKTVIIRK